MENKFEGTKQAVEFEELYRHVFGTYNETSKQVKNVGEGDRFTIFSLYHPSKFIYSSKAEL